MPAAGGMSPSPAAAAAGPRGRLLPSDTGQLEVRPLGSPSMAQSHDRQRLLPSPVNPVEDSPPGAPNNRYADSPDRSPGDGVGRPLRGGLASSGGGTGPPGRRDTVLTLQSGRTKSPAASPKSGGMSGTSKSAVSHHRATTTEPEQEGFAQASVFSCTINLVNSIIGAGILGLPKVLSECGYILGISVMLLVCILSTFSLHLFAACAVRLQNRGIPASFYQVAVEAIPRFSAISDIAVAVACLGNGMMYLIVIGDQMPEVMSFLHQHGKTAQNRLIWVVAGFCIVAPLASLPKLDSLRFVSLLSGVCVAFIMVMALLFALPELGALDPCADGVDCSGTTELIHREAVAIKSITVIIFCFVCHQNIFSVCNELKDATMPRLNTVCVGSQFTSCFLYIVVAISVYSTYGNVIDSDMLKTYPVVTVVTIARFCCVLQVACGYPLQAHPFRRCGMSLWQQAAVARQRDDGDGMSNASPRDEPDEVQKKVRYVTVTLLFLGTTLAVALSIGDLGVGLSVVGGTASTLLCYIIPGICYYKLFDTPHLKRSLAFALFVFGCIVVPGSLYATFGIADDGSSDAGAAPSG